MIRILPTDQEILSLVVNAKDICPLKMAITGGRHVGKTTRASLWHQALRQNGVVCAGFLEKAVFDPLGEKIGYDYCAVHSGAIKPFARCTKHASVLDIGDSGGKKTFRAQGYVYADNIWAWMMDQCSHAALGACWFWDEWGILEAEGGGICALYEYVSSYLRPKAHVCICRGDTFHLIWERLGGFDVQVCVENEIF